MGKILSQLHEFFIGVGLGFYILSSLAKNMMEGREKRIKQLEGILRRKEEQEQEK